MLALATTRTDPGSREVVPAAGGLAAPLLLCVGDVVAETYEVLGVLGVGGMGQVYEAYDRVLERTVALKVAPPGNATVHLLSEGRAMAALQHPSVASVYAMGLHAGLRYLAMERIQGVSLEDHIQHRVRAGERFTVDEVLDLVGHIAEGLVVVHRAGLSHRDVKPGNVMLAPGRRVVLMDFGLGSQEHAIAHETTIIGSPGYMAPELVLQTVEPGQGFRVDLYALGVVAFRLLTGAVPFEGTTAPETLRMHLLEPVPDVLARRPDAPPALASLVTELLQKHPGDRPPSADAVVWQLRSIATRRDPEADAGRLDVLVVDDDPVMVALLEHLVGEAVPDARVAAAASAEQALARYRRRPPDLMLLDLNLPGMSGIELCVYLRGTEPAPRCTIIAVSATATTADVQLLRSLGVVHFVAKGPVLRDRVVETLRELRRRL